MRELTKEDFTSAHAERLAGLTALGAGWLSDFGDFASGEPIPADALRAADTLLNKIPHC